MKDTSGKTIHSANKHVQVIKTHALPAASHSDTESWAEKSPLACKDMDQPL
jgi:hypothetical protein